MNKFKLIAILAFTLAVTGCTDDNYVSVRHPEGEVAEVTDTALGDDTMEEEAAEEEVAEENEVDEDEVVEVTDEDLEENPEADGVLYTVNGVVNVRLAPSENSNILTTVEAGDDLIKLGDSDNWSRVTVDGQTGYIRSDLLIAR